MADTKYNVDIIDKITGATLLYHENTFMNDEKTERWNKSFYHNWSRQYLKKEINHLLMGHFSQRYKDEKILLEVNDCF